MLVALMCGLLGCSNILMPEGLRVKSTHDYRLGALQQRKVAFIPLATSDENQDQRSGLVLRKETRLTAGRNACSTVAADRDEMSIRCNNEQLWELPLVAEVQRRFALDQPIEMRMWQDLRAASNSDYLLIFRPESASSSRAARPHGVVVAGAGTPILATTAIVSLIVAADSKVVTNNVAEVTYTVSASLVDLRTGRLLRVGVYSASDIYDVGMGQGAPVGSILERLMTDLGRWVLYEDTGPSTSPAAQAL
jgi:hypothetical protein